MKMKLFMPRIAIALVAGLMVAGMGFAQSVNYNYDRGTDFTKFKTYKLVPITDAKHPDQITDGNITSIVDGILAGKGLVKKDADPVDLFVGYGTTVQDQQVITGFGGGGFRFGGMGMTESLDPSSNPDKNYANLKKALPKLMKNYPPPVAK